MSMYHFYSAMSGRMRFFAFAGILITLWLLTSKVTIGGRGTIEDGNDVQTARNPGREQEMFSVEVHESVAEQHVRKLSLGGQTYATAKLVTKTETAAKVLRIPVMKGDVIEPGDLLCQLDLGTRKARLLQAEARFQQANLDFEAAHRLQAKGFSTDSHVRNLQANRDTAAAAVAEARLEIERTNIVAPFSGIVIDINTEIGDFLNVGSPCATIASYDPVLVKTYVSERHIAFVQSGARVRVELITGENLEGEIRFISPSARQDTRTFEVEIEIPNPDHRIREGLSGEVVIPLGVTEAHSLDSQTLYLDDSGVVGASTVDAEGKVKFFPVQIIENTVDKVWVTGLPERADVITVGQHYVKHGQKVRPIKEK